MTEINQNQKIFETVKLLFRDDYGLPFELTEGQINLFRTIYERNYPRNQFITYTQYGKTDVVAMAVLLRASTFPEQWPIVAPSKGKAKIMMSKIIKHIFENDYTRAKFHIDASESEERIRRERSKERLTFKVREGEFGEIFILSGEARIKTQDAGDILMGYGAPNLIEDESALIPNKIHGKALRMLGGHKDNFLVKIGNPFRRNHFLKSFQNPKYTKIIIDSQQGIEEGRIAKEYIEEMREELDEVTFNILYACKFPPEDVIDTAGWISLFKEAELENALVDEFIPFGFPNLGADPADTGTNESVIVSRWNNIARIDFANPKISLLEFCGKIDKIITENKIDVRNCAVDKVGVGAMIPDKMKELGKPIYGVNSGEMCDIENEKQQFYNQRAKLAWDVYQWIKGGGRLLRDERWYQLLNIKYKHDIRGRMQIMPKEEMRRQGIKSPDAFDALCLTFARPQIYHSTSLAEMTFNQHMQRNKIKKRVNPYNLMRNY